MCRVLLQSIGAAYAAKEDFDNAIKDYNRAIQLEPDYAEVYNNRGTAYANKDEFDNAIENFDKAIQLQPDYVNAYHNRGTAYINKGEYNQAIKDFSKAIDLDFEHVVLLIEDAVWLTMQKTGFTEPSMTLQSHKPHT